LNKRVKREPFTIALITGIVGFASGVMGIYDFISNKVQTDPTQEKLGNIEDSLFVMTQQIDMVEKTVIAAIAQTTLVEHEKTIKYCIDSIGKLAEYPGNKDFEKDFSKYCRDFERALRAFSESLAGNIGTSGFDLLQTTYQKEDVIKLYINYS